MSELLQRTDAGIKSHKLFLRGQQVLVAVSGGLDSMVLLHLLNSLAGENGWQISVAHFNHRLRGKASDADERLVRATAKKLGLKFFKGGADVKSFAVRSKLSIEMAARELRHEFLARIAGEQRIPAIALAHHADDQVELFFLRFLRGSGGEGLAGMKWISSSPASKNLRIARPLLASVKSELMEFARAEKIEFREDASNYSSDHLRNRIRHELLPLLQKRYQTGLMKTVLRTMEIAGAENEFVNAAAQTWLSKRGAKYGSLPVALQRKTLYCQLVAATVAPEFDLVEQLRANAGKWISLSPVLSVMRDAGGRVHLRETPSPFRFNDETAALRLRGRAGRLIFGGRNIRWEVLQSNSPVRPKSNPGTEFFDAESIGPEITLRHWRAGDRFQPIGMGSPVKLQDLFVNAKIPASIRRELILAATGVGEIFWVEGLRIGENFKLKPQTRRQLKWDWTKNSG